MAIRPIMRGASQMSAILKNIANNFPDHVAAALYYEAGIEMTEAKRRCPVDVTPPTPHPGQLRASGFVHQPVRRGRMISVTLSFGGLADDYAIYVHENLDAHHPVGQAKFLESTLVESQPYMGERIARRVHFSRMRVRGA